MLFQPKYMSKEMDKAMKAFDSELSQKDLIDIINDILTLILSEKSLVPQYR